jgi:hypothetical protein
MAPQAWVSSGVQEQAVESVIAGTRIVVEEELEVVAAVAAAAGGLV